MLNAEEKLLKPKKITKSHKDFISSYLTDNQDEFMESMEELRLAYPRRWAELYVEMTKLVIPKQSNVNVNVGINKDFRDLHLLATTKVGQKRVDGELVDKLEKVEPIELVDYEELPKEKSYAEV